MSFGVCVHQCVYANVGTQAETLAASVMVMRCMLFSWYVTRFRERPDEGLTRPSDLAPTMLGESSEPKLEVKEPSVGAWFCSSATNVDGSRSGLGLRGVTCWRLVSAL